MTRLFYLVMQSLRGIRSGLLIQLAATGSIAVGLLLVGLVLLGAINVERLTKRWRQSIQITVYLKPRAEEVMVKKLQHLLQKRPVVSAVQYISSKEAYQRLSENLGHRQSLLAGVEPGFLPASLELTLKESRPEQIRPLIAFLSTAEVVEEVDYLGHWTQRLSSLMSLIRFGGIAIAIIICLACLYIVSSTIRLGVFARREEIEILQLVGATDGYVRAPFLIEGALQGIMGAIWASSLLYAIYSFTASRFEQLVAAALNQMSLSFLSTTHLLSGILGGALLGLIGSRFALGRYLDV